MPFSRKSESLSEINRFYIQRKQDESPSEFKVVGMKLLRDSALVELEGLGSSELPEKLEGCLVMVETSDLPETDEDEYYWFQLIGLRVYTDLGAYVGKVENLIDRAQQSLLVVKDDENREYLVPMVDRFVKEINLQDLRIVISPIEGLL